MWRCKAMGSATTGNPTVPPSSDRAPFLNLIFPNFGATCPTHFYPTSFLYNAIDVFFVDNIFFFLYKDHRGPEAPNRPATSSGAGIILLNESSNYRHMYTEYKEERQITWTLQRTGMGPGPGAGSTGFFLLVIRLLWYPKSLRFH